MSLITRAYGASRLLLKAKAPTIMVVGGVTAMGTGTVLASIKTLKIEEVLEKHTPSLEQIQTGLDLNLDGYGPDVARADRFKVYSRVGVDLAKLYALPGVFLFGGAALIFGGHRIMLRRNATLALAFASIKKTLDAYRDRVVQSFGEEVDQVLMQGGTINKVKTTKSGDIIIDADYNDEDVDPYNRVFEQGASESWQNDLGVNKMFIAQQQRFAQERLNRRGHLYLSEVYEALGFPESDISRVVGWKVRRNPDGSKDFPMVDFGLDKPYFDDYKWSGMNAIYLDFNCQGLIVGGKLQRILEKA